MKKKLLSLVLAGAMVASTSVSAFAQDQPTVGESQTAGTTSQLTESVADGIINGTDQKNYTTNVNIEGSVQSTAGTLPSGSLSVTVPTAAAFTVTNGKKLHGENITIVNKGNQDVDVYACGFTDTRPGSGITVKSKTAIANEDRTNVSLWVRGELGIAYLSSTQGSQKTGIYSDESLRADTEVAEKKLMTVSKQSNKDLTLAGEAGQGSGEVSSPVSDNFTLVLKIKKSDGK